MKKIFILILPFLLLLSGCSNINSLAEAPPEFHGSSESAETTEVKAVWLTYYELQELIKNQDEKGFRKTVKSVLKELSDMGFNTVTVQVRPCADAFYPSEYFPSSQYCFGKQGAEMPYDPFGIICETAEKIGLRVEAWVNPYRVSQSNKIEELSDSNTAKKWYQNEKTKSYVYFTDKAIYFNPAVKEVNTLIVNGVKELVKNYPIAAVHFDDYFYPTTDKKIDEAEYQKYTKKGGKLNLSDWRRSNVDEMVKSVYQAVKSVNEQVRFGISPASNIQNDYNTLYADVEKWVSEEGYVDYICPQIYFGFRNVYQPFMFTTKKWVYMTECDLYIGLPLYKCGKEDKNAAQNDKSIINEFKNNDNIIARQITYLSKIEEVKGFYLFSYSCLKDDICKKEVEHLLEAMQSSNPD